MKMFKKRGHGRGLDPEERTCARCLKKYHPLRRARYTQKYCSNACRFKVGTKRGSQFSRYSFDEWYIRNTGFWRDISNSALERIAMLHEMNVRGVDLHYARNWNNRAMMRLAETIEAKSIMNGFKRQKRKSYK